jgi:hypothetical protein
MANGKIAFGKALVQAWKMSYAAQLAGQLWRPSFSGGRWGIRSVASGAIAGRFAAFPWCGERALAAISDRTPIHECHLPP